MEVVWRRGRLNRYQPRETIKNLRRAKSVTYKAAVSIFARR